MSREVERRGLLGGPSGLTALEAPVHRGSCKAGIPLAALSPLVSLHVGQCDGLERWPAALCVCVCVSMCLCVCGCVCAYVYMYLCG